MTKPDWLSSWLAVARSATTGPWVSEYLYEISYFIPEDEREDDEFGQIARLDTAHALGDKQNEANTQHITAASPDRMIALLELVGEMAEAFEAIATDEELDAGMGIRWLAEQKLAKYATFGRPADGEPGEI